MVIIALFIKLIYMLRTHMKQSINILLKNVNTIVLRSKGFYRMFK